MRSDRGVELGPLFHYDHVKVKGGQYNSGRALVLYPPNVWQISCEPVPREAAGTSAARAPRFNRAPVMLVDADEYGSRATFAGDEKGLIRLVESVEDAGRVLPKVAERNDVGCLAHAECSRCSRIPCNQLYDWKY